MSIETGSNYEPSEPEVVLEVFGFIESPEMKSIKVELIEALRADDKRVPDLVDRYRALGEVIADSQETSRGRMGLDVALALVLRDAGKIEDALYYLETTRYCAIQEGFKDITEKLERLIASLS